MNRVLASPVPSPPGRGAIGHKAAARSGTRPLPLRAALAALAVPLAIALARLGHPGGEAAAASAPRVGAAGARIAERFAERLEALQPGDPRAYFELGEEIAEIAADDGDRRLARDLFARAGTLRPDVYGRSACLAIAALPSTDEAERTRLRLAAMLLDTRSGGLAETPVLGGDAASADAAIALAEGMSLMRRGQGVRARRLFELPEVAALLDAQRHALDVARIRADTQAYRGTARPRILEEELARMLRVEAGLLVSSGRPWSSDVLVTANRPLVEADPTRLEELLQIDGAFVWWRRGAWRRDG
ncbi:MAG TPA: hypothetical protein PKC43_06765 [Phycisphaerales bacterium]|nr:hypothetical protein [Phycisphaerales bacterium]HMP37134.1 hypothetical protein [Phycisphaerales bacterium]